MARSVKTLSVNITKPCPRGSPPPLVSMAESKRDSLVGLQRLVYSPKTFTQDKKRREQDVKQDNGKSISKVHNLQKTDAIVCEQDYRV